MSEENTMSAYEKEHIKELKDLNNHLRNIKNELHDITIAIRNIDNSIRRIK